MPAAPDATLRLLDHAFLPRSVAVVGASSSRGKWSNDVFRLCMGRVSKTVAVPINPNRASVEGIRAYPSVSDVPHSIDYALIVLPRDHVLAAVRDCVRAKVPVVHVLSAGFGEVAGRGRKLQEELKLVLPGSDTVLIGPNSMGLYSAKAGLTFAYGCHFTPGPFSFVSQSGGICYEVLMRGQARGLSFSKILSVGNCADLDWPDYVRYFSDDPETEALALYIESVADGRALFDELKRASKIKPVFVLKGGKSQLGSQSVVSHTGRLAGEYDLWKAMLRQAGVQEVASVSDLLIAMQAWEAGQPILEMSGQAPLRAMVVGTGGGATVLVADACENASLPLAELDVNTVERLNSLVPEADSLGGVGNPLDVGADRLLGDPGLLAHLTEAACEDPDVNAVLIHLNLIAAANNLAGGLESWERTCDDLAAVGRTDKAIVLVLRNVDGGAKSEELGQSAVRRLRGNKGVHVFGDLSDGLKFLSGISARISPAGGTVCEAGVMDQRTETPGALTLNARQSRLLVEAYGVSFSPWRIATNLESALNAAEVIGYPAALKSAADDVIHKSDVGCVRIGLNGPESIRDAFSEVSANARQAGSSNPDMMLIERMVRGTAEIMIGLKRSETFGSTILVGLGGIWVELMRDFALRLCPVEPAEAFEMISSLRSSPVLTGMRGRPPGDLDALVSSIVAVSKLGAQRGDVVELDLNPVMVMERGQGVVAVDARVVLAPRSPCPAVAERE